MALSARAEIEAKQSSGGPIWDVYDNLWDPDSNPDGFVNIGVAENRLMHGELVARIARTPPMPEHSLTYGDGPKGSKRLRKVIAAFLSKRLSSHLPILPEHLVVTNGVSSAIEHCAWALTGPDEAWLLGQPYYGSFVADLTDRTGAKLIKVSFGDVDPLSAQAVARYEAAIHEAHQRGVKVKAVMLCNPHNPLGRCYSREALLAYLKLCHTHGLHLVSDEVYGLTIWQNTKDTHPSPTPFTSILSLRLDGLIDPSQVHALWGVSKDFGANGLRLGCVISQHNKPFLNSLTTPAIYSYISGLSDHVVAEVLEDEDWTDKYLITSRQRLADTFAFAVDILNRHSIPYTPGSNSGFFLWVDLAQLYRDKFPLDADTDVTQVIMDALMKNKVFLASGTAFGSERPGVFRITFSHPREYLEEGLGRLLLTLGLHTERELPDRTLAVARDI
ncbi:hypothetical protein ANO11243_020440 [Dothideomycetidae sp. 11243]|nr:hypothetical protein ANO11243_020440 [fungal sp. No.11243]